MADKLFLGMGSIAAALAVGLGAFGAHGLKARLSPEMMAIFQTAVQYHFVHALGLLVVGLASARAPGSPWFAASGWSLVAGLALFSGSLYVLALTEQRWLGAVTPLGGLAFIAGWVLLAVAALKS